MSTQTNIEYNAISCTLFMQHPNGSYNIDKVKLIENEIRPNGWPAADLPVSWIE